MFYISLALYFIAGIISIILCATFKSVWLDKPEKYYEEKFEKIEEDSIKAIEDASKKETKYNTTWKKIWDK